MAYTKYVTAAVAVSGAVTLTLSDVDNLYVGDKVRTFGTPSNQINGVHTITGVNTTNKTIAYTSGNLNYPATSNLTGEIEVLPQWTSDADVVEWLGIDSATANDTAFISECVEAANEWCFRKRQQAGYTTDRATFVPSGDVKLGTTMYAATLYRERGSVDSFASFDAMALGAAPNATFGRILQLLGVNRSQVA